MNLRNFSLRADADSVAKIVQEHKDRLNALNSKPRQRETWVVKSDMTINCKGQPFQRVKESIGDDGNITLYCILI